MYPSPIILGMNQTLQLFPAFGARVLSGVQSLPSHLLRMEKHKVVLKWQQGSWRVSWNGSMLKCSCSLSVVPGERPWCRALNGTAWQEPCLASRYYTSEYWFVCQSFKKNNGAFFAYQICPELRGGKQHTRRQIHESHGPSVQQAWLEWSDVRIWGANLMFANVFLLIVENSEVLIPQEISSPRTTA